MFKFLQSLVFLFIFCSLFSYHLEKQEVSFLKQKGEQARRWDVARFFHNTDVVFGLEQVVTDPIALQKAAQTALFYFNNQENIDSKILRPRLFEKLLSAKKVKETLEFIVSVIEQDKKNGRYRILDSTFLNKNFKYIKWSGDADSAHKNKVVIPESGYKGKIPPGKIRLTNYAIFILDGSYHKTRNYKYLYGFLVRAWRKL